MPETTTPPRAALEQLLFDDPDLMAYAIVDGAQTEGLPQRLLEMGARHECLFVGQLEPEVREVAPHLVSLNEDTGMLEHLLEGGWMKGWAIYLRSPLGMLDLRKHLRTLSLAELPDGEVVFFRYYDPLALRAVVPTMDEVQRRAFFGRDAVEHIFCEGDDPEEILRFPASMPTAPLEMTQTSG
ncbi:MAG: DUF4123 domain-containing protein [Paracoccaceae bacterium]